MLTFARFLLNYFTQLGFLGESAFSAENLQKVNSYKLVGY
jgi:hypothetical protein